MSCVLGKSIPRSTGVTLIAFSTACWAWKADDVVVHAWIGGEPNARAKIALRAPEQQAGDLELLRTRR
jgi:hypothetical protein